MLISVWKYCKKLWRTAQIMDNNNEAYLRNSAILINEIISINSSENFETNLITNGFWENIHAAEVYPRAVKNWIKKINKAG